MVASPIPVDAVQDPCGAAAAEVSEPEAPQFGLNPRTAELEEETLQII